MRIKSSTELAGWTYFLVSQIRIFAGCKSGAILCYFQVLNLIVKFLKFDVTLSGHGDSSFHWPLI